MTADSAQRKPTGIAVNRHGSDIEIVCLWFRWSALLQTFAYVSLTVLFISFLIRQSIALRSGSSGSLLYDRSTILTAMVFEAIFLIFFLRGVYAGVAGIINRTTIHIGEQTLTTHTGPLPFLVQNRKIPYRQIGRFFCDYIELFQGQRNRIYRTRPFKLYGVYIATVDRSNIQIVGYLPQLKQAAYVVTVLRRLIN